jgi:hypothetical protein
LAHGSSGFSYSAVLTLLFLVPFLNLADPTVFSQCFSLQTGLVISIFITFIPLWYMIIKLTHVLSSAATNFVSSVNIGLHVPAVLTHTHTHTHNLILDFKYSVFAASRWRVLPKHVARVPGNDAVCCGCWQYVCQFLGAFAKLRKATISVVMSVRQAAWNNSAPTGRIFLNFDI